MEDVIHNLRAALDLAGYSIAIAAGKVNPRLTNFPFAPSAQQFEKSAIGFCRDLPDSVQNIFRAYKPYKGGNDLLWALNAISVGEKHKTITLLGAVFQRAAISGSGSTTAGIEIIQDPVWDRSNNEIELARFSTEAEGGYNFGISFSVVFDQVPVVGGKPIIPVLHSLIDMVEDILGSLEAECHRLGYIA
jgi:hypothetical protein